MWRIDALAKLIEWDLRQEISEHLMYSIKKVGVAKQTVTVFQSSEIVP